ncbi:SigE family RNA polymerase sigma factor [Kribbella monticola]|uniref:SigE family RNA polymerase sigma factor n=1 Tax=Kribbella monticola TaxID=2185285 RepID=UPI000DD3720A|nr:SigE family RNA polymerase sigma factor [Kribbella monticola]
MRRRDEVDFTEFATAAVRRLRRTAYLMCGDWHRAEDAAQDALVRVYKAWNRLDHGGGLNTYAHKAVVSVVLDQAKKPWRREHVVDQPVEELLADAVGTIDDRLLVVEALTRLPPRQRACVVLRYYADLSIEDTATALDIGAGAVKSQSSRGLATLRHLLNRPELDEPANDREEVLS